MPELTPPSPAALWIAAGDALAKKVIAQAEVAKQDARMVNAWRWLYHRHGLTAKQLAAGMLAQAEAAGIAVEGAGIGFEKIRKAVGPRND